MRNRFGVETADAPAPPDACVAFVLVWVVWVSPAGGKRGPRVPSTPDSPTMAATAGVNDDVKDAGLGAWCNGFFADGAVVAAVAKFPSRVIPCDAAAPSTAPAHAKVQLVHDPTGHWLHHDSIVCATTLNASASILAANAYRGLQGAYQGQRPRG
eukprot:m.577524 g.577524  ORF g.577524 m.577524 type:complete len:155 (+) comp22296_c0_seq3:270-734(+)